MIQDSTEIIKRYLLGTATAAERAFVEESLSQPDFADDFTVTEDNLISEYNWGRLSKTDRDLFESNFMRLPGNRQKISFNQALLESIDELENSAPVKVEPKPYGDGSRSRPRKFLLPALGTIAAALLITLAAVIIFRLDRENDALRSKTIVLEEKLRQMESAAAEQRNESENFRRDFEDQKKINDELARQLEIEKAAPVVTKDENTKKLLPSPNAPDERLIARNTTVALDLSPFRGNLSNGESPRTLRLARQTKTAILNLTLPGTADASAYLVEITDSSGRPTFSQNDLKPKGQKLRLVVSSNNLNGGEATVTVYRFTEQGVKREVAGYRLTVNKN